MRNGNGRMCKMDRTSSARILVVESETMRFSAAAVLNDCYDRVRAVPDGRAAVDAFLTFAPDLIVLNLGYAVEDRVRTWDEIRSLSPESRRLLLVLSDSRLGWDEMTALDAGADDYIKKPVTPSRLCCRVQAILRRTFAEQAANGSAFCLRPPPSIRLTP